jgi:ABC-type uncharacterized transport system ATPase subunit
MVMDQAMLRTGERPAGPLAVSTAGSGTILGGSLAAVDPVLERSGLLARAGDRYRSYSLGMKQRLGIAAAMLAGPELLILDEPTNGLDPAGIVEMRGLIRSFAGDGITVLVSSHQLARLLRQAGCTVTPGDAAGALLVEESGISAAEVNRLAAQNGITLRQLGERTRSLERAFFALTGSRSADVTDGREMGAIR